MGVELIQDAGGGRVEVVEAVRGVLGDPAPFLGQSTLERDVPRAPIRRVGLASVDVDAQYVRIAELLEVLARHRIQILDQTKHPDDFLGRFAPRESRNSSIGQRPVAVR